MVCRRGRASLWWIEQMEMRMKSAAVTARQMQRVFCDHMPSSQDTNGSRAPDGDRREVGSGDSEVL